MIPYDRAGEARPVVEDLDPILLRPARPEGDVTVGAEAIVRGHHPAKAVINEEVEVGVAVARHCDGHLSARDEAEGAGLPLSLLEVEDITAAVAVLPAGEAEQD